LIVELVYEWRREAQLRRVRHPRVLYVTDLVRCPLKRRFEILFPELASQDLMGPASVAGLLLHLGIESVVAEYAARRGYSVEAEVEVARVVRLSADEYVLSGRPDIVLRAGSEPPTVVEVKTSRSDASIPYGHHVLQVQLYAWMLNAKEALLIYVTPERIAEFSLSELGARRLTEADVVRLAEETVSAAKAPRYEWECRYCRYAVVCPRKVSASP